MVLTVFRVGLGRLLHNRVELMLTFVVPIAFFSIFALIFGRGLGGSSTPKIKAVAIDSVGTPQSRLVIERIRKIEGLRIMEAGKNQKPVDEVRAKDLVRRGMVTIAVVLREDESGLSADLLSDASDQVASQVCSALIAQALLAPPQTNYRPNLSLNSPSDSSPPDSSPPDSRLSSPVIASSGPESTKPNASPADYAQGSADFSQQKSAKAEAGSPALPDTALSSRKSTKQGAVRIVDVISGDRANPVVSMYAAGIAVMFLLFGATGSGGSLLEEQESQTLHRLLTTQLTMDQLLMGKWLYQTTLGVVQIFVMFLWGWLIFGVDLWNHFDGFLLMTTVTAGAAASFGLLLATISRSRGQLNGISVILILTMSALGGSMVPRYLMSETLRDAGLYTFNAWALDGYDKVFWRELPASELWPQICVLMLCGAAFLIAARLLAVRWETA